jgi:hypothetical protein
LFPAKGDEEAEVPWLSGQSPFSPSNTHASRTVLSSVKFFGPYRRLNRAIRELSVRIREARCGVLFGADFQVRVSPQNQHPNSRITSPAVISPGHWIRARRPAVLLPSWGLPSQPRSPKRLGHRVAAGGHGIASGYTRVSAGRGRFSDPVESNSVRAAVGLAALASFAAMPNQLPLSPARVWHMGSAKQSTGSLE